MTGREPTQAEELQLRRRVKQQLRQRMRSIRRTVPADARAQRSARIAGRVVRLAAFERAGTVLSYMPIRAEVDPGGVVEAARAAAKVLGLPRVDFEANELALHRWQQDDALAQSPMGILEPHPDAPRIAPAEVDLVLVPALAVDERGQRIGYGKGFYDQLLQIMPRAVRCAVIYDFQLIPEVPAVEHDEPVHLVVTDARVVEVDPSQ